MTKNYSQKGFVETVALLGVALMLLTLPLASKLAKERQETRKFAQEADCSVDNKCIKTDDPSQCYKYAGSGCDWSGPLQPEQGECYCKLSRVSVSQQQAQQQAEPSQTTCDKANYSWCKDGIRYYCNENKNLTPISQKWQEGNSCYVCGTTVKEPVSLSECTSDITNQCEGKNIGDPPWCENSVMTECVRDPSGYLVKNYTSTPCSGAQTTTTPEKPAAPTAITTPEYSQGPCGGNDGRCPGNTICMCKLVNGSWTPAETSKQTGFAACCSQTPVQQPPTITAPATNFCTGKTDGNYPSGNKCIACSRGGILEEFDISYCPFTGYKCSHSYLIQYINNIAQRDPKRCPNGCENGADKCNPAPAESAPKNIYLCQKYDDGKYYARYYDNNGNITSNKPCEHGCKNDRECNPAPVQPAQMPYGCKPTTCNQVRDGWSSRALFMKCPIDRAKTACIPYEPPNCLSKEITDIEEYCEVKEVKNAEVPAPKITETTEETDAGPKIPQPRIVRPVENPCEFEVDDRAVIHQNSCWTCLNGQLYQMTNDESCGIKPAPKQKVTQPKPPAAKPERSITFMERVSNAFCITPPISLFCQLGGYVPF